MLGRIALSATQSSNLARDRQPLLSGLQAGPPAEMIARGGARLHARVKKCMQVHASSEEASMPTLSSQQAQKLLEMPTISVPEYAAIVGVSRRHAYNLAAANEVATLRAGKRVRVI